MATGSVLAVVTSARVGGMPKLGITNWKVSFPTDDRRPTVVVTPPVSRASQSTTGPSSTCDVADAGPGDGKADVDVPAVPGEADTNGESAALDGVLGAAEAAPAGCSRLDV